MAKKYWMVKQEPDSYSWDDFVKDGKTDWTGVRNFQARNNLRSMQTGDRVLFYHSGKAKAVVGVAEVARSAYPDPSASEGDWVAVDLQPVAPLVNEVSLADIKADPALAGVPLIRQSQLSVMEITKADFDRITKLGKLRKT